MSGFSDGLALTGEGFVNPQGTVVLPVQFLSNFTRYGVNGKTYALVRLFSDGLAAVMKKPPKGEARRLIDPKGKCLARWELGTGAALHHGPALRGGTRRGGVRHLIHPLRKRDGDMTDLFSPLELRKGVIAPNRIWLAPLTNTQSHPDGTLSDAELRFLAMRADGGFGLVETCAVYVAQDGKAWPGELGVHDDAMLPGMKRLAARIHEGGALIAAQLFHGGLRANPDVSQREVWSASAYDAEGIHCREATEADIEGTLQAFADAARRCEAAGFDVVELHGAHGYLLSQFLSNVFNRRTDRWGGALENRWRLLQETVRAVKRAAPSLVLSVRLSTEDARQARGIDLDESLEVARMLQAEGVEILHLSLWKAALNTQKRPDQHATPLFRQAVGPDMRIVVAGEVRTREEAEAQLARGADAVAVGRAAIANHDWPRRVQRGAALQVPPLSPTTLHAEGLSDVFVKYMRNWRDFVADTQD
ncbi:NADH:flavin oxidoreductase [Comamonas sp. JC664]|uniref:NADH:flavin oxidoreductase n=1 Tax=Comamonas sp. JC664 TaxID=2801917 RepID=UPI0019202301|nr:NADH:flavin oxidoreductase [Comamonas sp. JC664]MBL0696737.1 NADH:flavin oxidoreductase [Comamonas sp. JC664]